MKIKITFVPSFCHPIPLLKFDRQGLTSRVIAIFRPDKWFIDSIQHEMLNVTLRYSSEIHQ